MTIPTMTIREYNPETGAMLNNVANLSCGRVTRGTHSRVKVVDIAFTNATYVGNLKIGLIADAGVTANDDPQEQAADGTTSSGHFGIESSEDFDASKASSALVRHFPGLNESGTAEDVNNVLVEMRSDTVSNYIYLDIEVGSSNSGLSNGSYKIFFDYS